MKASGVLVALLLLLASPVHAATPVPDNLTPPLDNPNNDTYCYRPGYGVTGNCRGDPNGTRSVAVYGDSHSGQWLAAFQVVAERRHWRLTGYAYSSCPSVHVNVGYHDAQCRTYRAAAEKAMRQKPPHLIVLTNYSHYDVTRSAWKTGLRATLAALPKSSRVLVLADTALFPESPPECLQRHLDEMEACEIPRSEAYRVGWNRAERMVVGTERFVSMNGWICPSTDCPVVTGRFLMWRDEHHLTVAYSRQLAPALGQLLTAQMPQTK